MFSGGLEFSSVAEEMILLLEGVSDILDSDEMETLVPLEGFAGIPDIDAGGTVVLLGDFVGIPGFDVRGSITLEGFPGVPDIEVLEAVVPLNGFAGIPDIEGKEMIVLEGLAGASDVGGGKMMVLLEDFTGFSGTGFVKSLAEIDDALGTDGTDVIVSLEGINDSAGTDSAGMLDGAEGIRRDAEDIPYLEGEDTKDSSEEIADALDIFKDGVAERGSGVRGRDVVDTSGVGESICGFRGERTEPIGEGEVPFVMYSCRRNRAMYLLRQWCSSTCKNKWPYVLDFLDFQLSAHPRGQRSINSRSRTLERNTSCGSALLFQAR